MKTAVVSQEKIRDFTRQQWQKRKNSQNLKVMKKCEECFKKWEINGRKNGEQKPLYYPEDYNGKCLCGGELSRPQLFCGI